MLLRWCAQRTLVRPGQADFSIPRRIWTTTVIRPTIALLVGCAHPTLLLRWCAERTLRPLAGFHR